MTGKPSREEQTERLRVLVRHAAVRANEMRGWMLVGMSEKVRRREFDRFTRDRDEYEDALAALPVVLARARDYEKALREIADDRIIPEDVTLSKWARTALDLHSVEREEEGDCDCRVCLLCRVGLLRERLKHSEWIVCAEVVRYLDTPPSVEREVEQASGSTALADADESRLAPAESPVEREVEQEQRSYKLGDPTPYPHVPDPPAERSGE